MLIDPKKQSSKDSYKLMVGSILPRPIALVSTLSKDGIRNLAPFSFFMGVCSRPPTIAFAPAVRTGDVLNKDSLNNIRETGEFGVNIVSEDFAEKMVKTATEFPPDVDEYTESGLTPVQSKLIKPPLVQEARIRYECKLDRIVQVGDGLPGSGSVVLGEIVMFHVDDDLISEGRIDVRALKAVGRMAGRDGYCRTGDLFEIERR